MEILKTRTDKGLVRYQNEDAVLAVKHKKNKNIKLLIVADGMGGRDKGEVASNYVVKELESWFQNKSIKLLNNTEEAKQLLMEHIKKINNNLIKKYGEDVLGTTLTLALINKNNTLILNVGDSRAYRYRKHRLNQITEDDSDVWRYYKNHKVKKEHLRYFQNSNIITACVGICKELCIITPTIIKNDYDVLLLVTDGISDILTDRKLSRLIRHTKKEDLIDKIIIEAVHKNQNLKIPSYLKRKYTANYAIPYHGRDNASIALYIKEV